MEELSPFIHIQKNNQQDSSMRSLMAKILPIAAGGTKKIIAEILPPYAS